MNESELHDRIIELLRENGRMTTAEIRDNIFPNTPPYELTYKLNTVYRSLIKMKKWNEAYVADKNRQRVVTWALCTKEQTISEQMTI